MGRGILDNSFNLLLDIGKSMKPVICSERRITITRSCRDSSLKDKSMNNTPLRDHDHHNESVRLKEQDNCESSLCSRNDSIILHWISSPVFAKSYQISLTLTI